MRRIIKLFEDGNVCVCGLKGRGKDMLMANVTQRRRLPYVCNVDYGGDWIPFVPSDFDCGGNTYKNFITGDINYYEYPFPEGTDVYISDVGIYFPAQYCDKLNRDYGYFATYMAIPRHVADANVHFNVQNLNRAWDKIREQSDTYIMCNKCIVFRGWVFQMVTIYEKYQSAVDRVPPFRVPKPFINPDRLQQWRLAKLNYDIAYGEISRRLLVYKNLSSYDTRIFREVLKNGKKKAAY